jgi:hypothetical protein
VKHLSRLRSTVACAAALGATLVAVPGPARAAGGDGVAPYTGLTAAQKQQLMSVARDSWTFFADDVDAQTHLPLDNLTYAGGSSTPTSRGTYTSSANIGVYLWSLVSASDLGLISRDEATTRTKQTLREVATLPAFQGFLYQWYDTTTGHVILNPGQGDCPSTGGTFDNCSFVSNVDNGWYASGLVVAEQAFPGARKQASALLAKMDFSLFYDDRAETHCNVNRDVQGNQPTGQMFGGYYAGNPPDVGDNWTHYYHNGALYSDPRISAYLGMGRGEMPGNVWWRSWRELPPAAPYADCADDPDFSWQGQWPMNGSWEKVTDPQSGKVFDVWEGSYTYPGTDLKFIPTFAGGMFEALMANEVVPETSWGTQGFGLADKRTVEVQQKYATEELGFPVWGLSPSSTADDSGGYAGFGVDGLTFPYHGQGATAEDPNQGLSQCWSCAQETTVTPHASFLALDASPQAAYENIMKLKTMFPDVYGAQGFYDALNPTTGAVGHRILVLDQSMIMAALDNALRNRALQRHFAADPVSSAAHTYLAMEHMAL